MLRIEKTEYSIITKRQCALEWRWSVSIRSWSRCLWTTSAPWI